MNKIIFYSFLISYFTSFSHSLSAAEAAGGPPAPLSFYSFFPEMTAALLEESLNECNGINPISGITRQRYKDLSVLLNDSLSEVKDDAPPFAEYHKALKKFGSEMDDRNIVKIRVKALVVNKTTGRMGTIVIDIPYYFISGYAEQYIADKGEMPPVGPARCIVAPTEITDSSDAGKKKIEEAKFCFVTSFTERSDFIKIIKNLLLVKNHHNLYVKPILNEDNMLVQPESAERDKLFDELKSAFEEYDNPHSKADSEVLRRYIATQVGLYFAHSEQSALIYLKKKIEKDIQNKAAEVSGTHQLIGVMVHIITERDMCQNCFKTMYQLMKHKVSLADVPMFIFVTGTKEHNPHIQARWRGKISPIGSRFIGSTQRFTVLPLLGGRESPIDFKTEDQFKLFVNNE